jgi:4-hydroxy-3-methylbut-2-enyl diphosphate reductase
MKVYKANYSGFCFGVKRAIQNAKDCAFKCKNVYIKGDLVHNEIVCKEIEKVGIKKVHSLEEIPPNSTLIIKAHGEPLKTYQAARAKKIKIEDATCPMVLAIHKKARKMEEEGYEVIIIGDRHHEETIGILGNIKKGIIVENKKDIGKIKFNKKVGVVCQSTQNIENVTRLISQISKKTEELLFINTICQPTKLRQREVEKLALKCEAILVVGSKKSANTKRLYYIAKKINNNAFWISSTEEVKKEKFRHYHSVGIIGGASTPQYVLGEIYKKLQ